MSGQPMARGRVAANTFAACATEDSSPAAAHAAIP
jgi:hypothetical protein